MGAAPSGEAAREPRSRGLLRRLLAATLAPTVIVLVVFGFLAHEVAQRALEEELGKRLGTAAAAVAAQILPAQIEAIGAGDEGSNTYANLSRRIESARHQLGVRRVGLVARDLAGRGDTAGRIALGAPAHELGADAVEIERAAGGGAVASPLFVSDDGQLYKRAYARVGDSGAAAGFVFVEGSADYFVSLAIFRRWLMLAGAVGLGAVVAFTAVMARRMTGPLRRLAGAADRIGHGDLEAAVPVETRDEVGFLAVRLDEMRAALRARDERLQMTLAGIAHEVRNPLGGLELYAGLLREGLAGQRGRLDEVARIDREIVYLKAVVTEFLDYARRAKPEMAEVPLRPLFEEVAEVCAGAKIGAKVRVEVAGEIRVAGDRAQIRRALLNLARNAITAAGPSGVVVLAARGSGAVVECEVRDSGPGVPEDAREKVFAPFFTTRQKGTGLGLAFVRDILRDHGADIAVDRAPEGGACFRFSLKSAGYAAG